MSPVADLAPVAAAGRQTGRAFLTLKGYSVAQPVNKSAEWSHNLLVTAALFFCPF
jgi:hypothetical protein